MTKAKRPDWAPAKKAPPTPSEKWAAKTAKAKAKAAKDAGE